MFGKPIILAAFGFLPLLFPSTLSAQRFGSQLDVTRSRIGDERVQRQSEVLRIERALDMFESRVTRLERFQLNSSQGPAITIAEALATVEFATAQLTRSEQELERGEVDELQVAADRLAVTRAQGQLDSARSAHEERVLILELDLVYSERKLLQLSKERELAERFTAKGYTSSDSLKYLLLDEKLAQKEMQITKLRLANLRKAAGQESPPPAAEPDEPTQGRSRPESVPRTIPSEQ